LLAGFTSVAELLLPLLMVLEASLLISGFSSAVFSVCAGVCALPELVTGKVLSPVLMFSVGPVAGTEAASTAEPKSKCFVSASLLLQIAYLF
jgi:hypothetical protein